MRVNDRKRAFTSHRYVVEPGGEPMPGVTAITGMLPKDGLKWGAAKLTAQIAIDELPELRRQRKMAPPQWVTWLMREHDVRWKAKAELGNRVHGHALDWAAGRAVDVLDDEKGFMDALERFIETEVIAFIMMEEAVGCPRRKYGGRFDWVAVLRNRGVCLGDYKTGSEWPLEHGLQAVALARADGVIRYDGMGNVSLLEPLPPLEQLIDVYLQPNGTYVIRETPNEQMLWDLFCSLADSYHQLSAVKRWFKDEMGIEIK